MVLDLLDIGRSEDGQLEAMIAAVDVARLFAELAREAAARATQQELICEPETTSLRGDVAVLEPDIGALEREAATVGHGVTPVDREVHHDLL